MKHIVFTIDHKFVRFCAVTMVSILKNDTPSDITVHVVANGLSEADRTILSDLAITYGALLLFMKFLRKNWKDMLYAGKDKGCLWLYFIVVFWLLYFLIQ